MKQVAQRPRDGRIVVMDVPEPTLREGWVLVDNASSLISAGTERTKLELGSMSIAQKARARPDLTKQVIRRMKSDGIRSTLTSVRDRLDSLAPLGYSSAGTVRTVGAGIEGIQPGDRVACGGGGWANHAEVIVVPKNLVAKIPDGVNFDDAAYATVGSIALHGVRQSAVGVGERVGVIGLGLVGQLVVRILLASGCVPIGIDLEEAAVSMAAAANATAFNRNDPNLQASILDACDGAGVDAVIICAATNSADPVRLGADLARDRARIVVVGDVPIEADRNVFYEKELELRLSRSYGPGRYDVEFEQHGRDLPLGYVRWTEQRNLGAFLDLLARGRVEVSTLTTHRFPVREATEAYAVVAGASLRNDRPFGVLLQYEQVRETAPSPERRAPSARVPSSVRVGLIGAGSYARRVVLPRLRDGGARLVAVASEGGLSAADVAARFGFDRASSAEEILHASDIDGVVIASRHSNHAALAAAAIRAGKAVFVEKPLALTWEQLRDVEDAAARSARLMVGFNRRFAPFTRQLIDAFGPGAPRVTVARVNAGQLPRDHWLNDPDEGGGRLIGEGCHFVDLLAFIAQGSVQSVHAGATPHPGSALELTQNFVGVLEFSNGCIGCVVYAGEGDPQLAKERIEAYGDGIAAVIDDFRRLEIYRSGKKDVTRRSQDKGHADEFAYFVDVLRGAVEPPSMQTYFASTRATLALADALRTNERLTLPGRS